MRQVPLVGALFTRVQHFDMIHYGSYLSAASPFWLVAFPQGVPSGCCMAPHAGSIAQCVLLSGSAIWLWPWWHAYCL